MRHLSISMRLLAAAFILVIASALPGDDQLGNDKALDEIVASWRLRQNRIRCVEYVASGTHKIPRGAYNTLAEDLGSLGKRGNVPSEDKEVPMNFTLLLDFDQGRHRRKITLPSFAIDTGKITTMHTTDAFNGSLLKEYTPREENVERGPSQPDLTIVSGDIRSSFHCSAIFPIFFGHGRIVTAGSDSIKYGRLRSEIDAKRLFVHGYGVQEETKCTVLRTRTTKTQVNTEFEEYWVDREKECAVVRYVEYVNEKRNVDMEIHYRDLIVEGVHYGWFPDNWRWSAFVRGQILYTEDLRVDRVMVNLPINDEDFDLNVMKTGMIVEETVYSRDADANGHPARRISVYQVKEGGERQAMPDPYHREGDQYLVGSGNKRVRYMGIFLVLLTVITASLIYWLKRRRVARS